MHRCRWTVSMEMAHLKNARQTVVALLMKTAWKYEHSWRRTLAKPLMLRALWMESLGAQVV